MKLPETVEWLERNYDTYEIYEFGAPPPHGIEFMTTWYPGFDLGDARYEMGQGSNHRQPMFTLKDLGHNSHEDCYQWRKGQFVPLSPESEKAPLDDDGGYRR